MHAASFSDKVLENRRSPSTLVAMSGGWPLTAGLNPLQILGLSGCMGAGTDPSAMLNISQAAYLNAYQQFAAVSEMQRQAEEEKKNSHQAELQKKATSGKQADDDASCEDDNETKTRPQRKKKKGKNRGKGSRNPSTSSDESSEAHLREEELLTRERTSQAMKDKQYISQYKTVQQVLHIKKIGAFHLHNGLLEVFARFEPSDDSKDASKNAGQAAGKNAGKDDLEKEPDQGKKTNVVNIDDDSAAPSTAPVVPKAKPRPKVPEKSQTADGESKKSQEPLVLHCYFSWKFISCKTGLLRNRRVKCWDPSSSLGSLLWL